MRTNSRVLIGLSLLALLADAAPVSAQARADPWQRGSVSPCIACSESIVLTDQMDWRERIVRKGAVGQTEAEARARAAAEDWSSEYFRCHGACWSGGLDRYQACNRYFDPSEEPDGQDVWCRPQGGRWVCTVRAIARAGSTVGCRTCSATDIRNANIVNVGSGKCLEVRLASMDDGAMVQDFRCNNQANQQWHILFGENGYAHIVAAHSNKCLEVKAASLEAGADVQQGACGRQDNQLWRLFRRSGPIFDLVPRHAEVCVGLLRGNALRDVWHDVNWGDHLACLEESGEGATEDWARVQQGHQPLPLSGWPPNRSWRIVAHDPIEPPGER